jgi:polyisoprenoid-binding protein YceI
MINKTKMRNYKKLTTALITIIFGCVLFAFSPAGKVYLTHTGHIWFFAGTAMEDINADNYQVASNLNSTTGEMAYSVLVKGFAFRRALMQEHFNENYMESDKYPKSTFKGKVADISKVDFDKNGTYNVNVSGDLNIHGVTKSISAPGTITVSADSVHAKSTFKVALKDYNITIPSVVKDKISETVQIHVDVAYSKK